MWNYEKRLEYPVNIKNVNPAMAKLIITQLGGPNGEMGAATRYLSQRYSAPYAEVKATLTDIGSKAAKKPGGAAKPVAGLVASPRRLWYNRRMDIKDKINKLLALSQSPNENEAQLALLKAKELMMEHKLSIQDLTAQDVQVIHHETPFTYSRRRSAWTLQLANVIAENYCCRAFCRRRSRQQTRTVCLAGFPDDVQLCEKALGYALDCIGAWVRRIARPNRKLYSARELGGLSDSYARGYIAGLYVAYHRQRQAHEEEWALVAAVPNAVDESVKNLRTERACAEEGIIRSVYNVGFGDGLHFCMSDKLTEKK